MVEFGLSKVCAILKYLEVVGFGLSRVRAFYHWYITGFNRLLGFGSDQVQSEKDRYGRLRCKVDSSLLGMIEFGLSRVGNSQGWS